MIIQYVIPIFITVQNIGDLQCLKFKEWSISVF